MMPFTLLYIDPGTGSMLFSILIALATTIAFGARVAWMKLRFIITRGKKEKTDARNQGIVIYSDDKRYWNVFGPVCREGERREVDIVYMTQSADDPALAECKDYKHIKAEFIGEGNKGIAKMNFLVADVVLSTTPNLDVFQWKRSREVGWYVHISHAITDLIGYKMFGMDSYNAVLLTGEYQASYIRRMEAMRKIEEKELCTVGYPPLDEDEKKLSCMAENTARQGAQAGDRSGEEGEGGEEGDDVGRKTVLLAPSWGESSILHKYGDAVISALVATGYRVIVRPHPQTAKSEQDVLRPLMEKFPSGGAQGVEWNFDNDNMKCLSRADVMVSDFSSVVFEYAILFDRPVICADAIFDPAVYDAAWFPNEKGWYLDTVHEFSDSLDASDFGNMKAVLDNAIASDRMKSGRDKVRREVWTHKGESAKCVVDYLVRKQNEVQCARVS